MSVTPYEHSGQQVEPMMRAGSQVDLYAWVTAASEVHRIAQALATTNFVPANLRGKPDEVAAQILYGRDVNLPPMVALQQIHVIEGRPSMSALAMRGLAMANGVKFRHEEQSAYRCVMLAKAPGDQEWTRVQWDMDRAKKLGVTGKTNWTKQPQAMLIARATSELCRLVAAPLFLGLSYSIEELTDGGNDVAMTQLPTSVRETEEKPRTRTVRRKTDEPVTSSQPPSTQEPPSSGHEHVSDEVRKALMVAFRDAGMDERATRLAYVSDLLKREVISVNEITDAEGQQVLDQLKIDTFQGLEPQEVKPL